MTQLYEQMYAQGRPEPSIDSDEAAMLLGYLERQRATFAWKVGGLDEAGLRATLGPSSMTLGGMLKHLARFEDDMSHEWLLGQGQRPPWDSVDWDTDHAWDWRTAAEDSPEALYILWRDAVERSRALFARALAGGESERADDGSTGTAAVAPGLRYILINMIERVRASQRPRRPHPRVGGRARRARSAGLTADLPQRDSCVPTDQVRGYA